MEDGMIKKARNRRPEREGAASTTTTTAHQLLAAEIMKVFQEGAARIPGWNDKLVMSAGTAQRVTSPEMIAKAVNAAEAIPELLALDPRYPGQARDTEQFAEAFLPMITELQAIMVRLERIVRVRETKAGRGALRMYAALRHLFPELKNRELAAIHLDLLRTEYKRWRTSRKGY